MPRYEFKVIPAPTRGEKSRDARTAEERFARAMTQVLNQMAREGWDYLRAESLPSVERVGLFNSRSGLRHLLVFRRAVDEGAAGLAPLSVTRPAEAPRLGPATEPAIGPAPALGPAE